MLFLNMLCFIASTLSKMPVYRLLSPDDMRCRVATPPASRGGTRCGETPRAAESSLLVATKA